ncbi:MAG: DEAD/DEAH box helicase family protein [Deltaproteobacteria bacterium]|nr:DEAD/DEAH box helicase family protein [Deltaproteobacteria bacterium]
MNPASSSAPAPAVTLRFRAGTIEIAGRPADTAGLPASWDERSACLRAPACAYAAIVRGLRARGVPYSDQARRYDTMATSTLVHREPRPYQTAALAAWRANGFRGVVVLPTGAGKTLVAHLAIDDRKRSALVVTPTLDLVRQWHDGLLATFGGTMGGNIGIVGGGDYDVRPLTVTTYDSAYLHMEHLGDRFGLVVFDECHHLPGESYALGARLCLAPFRLGLTATPERSDGRDAILDELCGPVVYRKDIVELAGEYLADYETVRVSVDLSPAERAEYERERAIYRQFVGDNGIVMTSPRGFSDFIIRSSRSEAGRRAFAAYRRQREIAFTAPAKLDYLERLLFQHRHDRAIVFTQDNATVYLLSRRFLVPAITHLTKVSERSAVLAGFSRGEYAALATSRVLNEGVDIPEANVAVVMSGSGSVREHVQRLGRILRPRAGKRAVLYELVTGGTSESMTSTRRRDHVAYR